MYSMYWHAPVISEFFNQPAEKFRPAATILAYTLSDYIMLSDAYEKLTDPMAKGLFEASVLAFTGISEPDRKLLEEISPARQVNAKTPPMFLWATAGDGLVPAEHTTVLATSMTRNAGTDIIYIFLRNVDGCHSEYSGLK